MIVHESIYVDGAWIRSTNDETVTVTDPATGAVVAVVPRGTEADVHAAVTAARRAFEPWSSLPAEQRTAHLSRLVGLMIDDADELGRLVTLEMGSPASIVMADHVQPAIDILTDAVKLNGYRSERVVGNSLIVREPIGVAAAITPWNYPLYQLLAKVAPALAVGCAVVVKPSELAPLSTYRFTELVDAAGFPAGVYNLVPGRGAVVGQAMAAHDEVDVVSFTGSTAAGRQVMQTAAGTIKKVALELGGKSASIILPDADLHAAVEASVENCMTNAGQSCSAWTRLLVPRELQSVAIAIAASVCDRIANQLGPVISQEQYDTVQSYIAVGIAEGAKLAAGGPGRIPGRERGFYCRPTVFAEVANTMRVAREEIFGPVLTVLPYDGVESAISMANDSPYGLHGAVWAATPEEGLAVARRLRTGQVDVNGAAVNLSAPFGGYKQSGTGRELGEIGFEEYLEIKAVQLPAGVASDSVL